MRTRRSTMLGVFLLLASLALAAPAHALPYSALGTGPMHFPGPVTPPANAPWGPGGYPGDTVELLAYASDLPLTPGSHVQKIGTLRWVIDYTYAGTATDPDDWSDLSFPVDGARGLSFGGGPVGPIGQTGLLKVTWENDYLSFAAGPAVSFFVPGYRIDVTPLGLAEVGGSNFADSNPWLQPDRDLMARFDVSAVPEPSTLLLLGSGLAGLGVTAWRRARRQ